MRRGRWAGWLGDLGAVLGMALIGGACLHKFNGGFDALAYHLPFAALRTGLLTPEQFTLPPLLADRLAGFPPLADWVQGGLWRLFGRAEAAALIAPLAVIGFAAYGRAAFGIPMLFATLIFLAVPILHAALDAMYVDLWTNAAFAVHLLAAWRAVTGCRLASRSVAVSMAALAAAVWSKPQFAVVGALSCALVAALLAVRARRGDTGWRPLLICLLLAPLCFAWPLRNLLLFGNPVWPISVRLGPITLPGTQVNVWDGPDALQHAPNAWRYLLSQLDLDAVNLRPGGYNVDQGYQRPGMPGWRMGGSLAVLLLTALAALAIGLARRRPSRDAALAGAAFLLMVVLVANLPGANELRYFSFVEIIALFAALAVLRAGARAGDAYLAGLATGVQVLLISAAVFTSFITGGLHLLARGPTLREEASAAARAENLAAARAQSSTLCYVGEDFRGLLFTPLFAPDPPGGGRVVEAYAAADCPAGAVVLGRK